MTVSCRTRWWTDGFLSPRFLRGFTCVIRAFGDSSASSSFSFVRLAVRIVFGKLKLARDACGHHGAKTCREAQGGSPEDRPTDGQDEHQARSPAHCHAPWSEAEPSGLDLLRGSPQPQRPRAAVPVVSMARDDGERLREIVRKELETRKEARSKLRGGGRPDAGTRRRAGRSRRQALAIAFSKARTVGVKVPRLLKRLRR